MNWKEVVKDPDEVKVFMALDGPSYTWRTVGGIARHTGLNEGRVLEILAKYSLLGRRFLRRTWLACWKGGIPSPQLEQVKGNDH